MRNWRIGEGRKLRIAIRCNVLLHYVLRRGLFGRDKWRFSASQTRAEPNQTRDTWAADAGLGLGDASLESLVVVEERAIVLPLLPSAKPLPTFHVALHPPTRQRARWVRLAANVPRSGEFRLHLGVEEERSESLV